MINIHARVASCRNWGLRRVTRARWGSALQQPGLASEPDVAIVRHGVRDATPAMVEAKLTRLGSLPDDKPTRTALQ